MAFIKNGETKVYRKGKKIGPKFASKDESNRFTIDDLVQESNKKGPVLPTPVNTKKEEEEDVSN